ncbi:zinc finger, CCHC-type, retrotransposon gag domain protein [Tanacetum coccineum]|uniref:Zinc finger, CCHC-type, retrotransposon gag domain protein n=1 Tax=Tanacetum coccineum TaxID=301880 RepID=A0ABQ5E252_9ASTR
MVNTRTDAELAAAIQAAVDAMLPHIREQVREEYRAGASGGQLSKSCSFLSSVFPSSSSKSVEGEYHSPSAKGRVIIVLSTCTTFPLRLAGFLGQAAGTAEEKVADAARNLGNPFDDRDYYDRARTFRQEAQEWRTDYPTYSQQGRSTGVTVRVMTDRKMTVKGLTGRAVVVTTVTTITTTTLVTTTGILVLDATKGTEVSNPTDLPTRVPKHVTAGHLQWDLQEELCASSLVMLTKKPAIRPCLCTQDQARQYFRPKTKPRPNGLGNVGTDIPSFQVPHDTHESFRLLYIPYPGLMFIISLSLYPFTERYSTACFFSCFLRQMVNTRTMLNSLHSCPGSLVTAMLPQSVNKIREEYRKVLGELAVYNLKGDALAWWKAYKQAKGGDAWILTLSWANFKELFFLQFFPRAEQERLKREYHSLRQRAGESSNEFMQRFIRIAGFLGQAAGTAEEQAKNFRWGLHKSILDRILCMEFTDVAQVADAARNFEILRDRDDYDRPERSDKRHKSGDQHQSSNQQNSHRGHDQRNDRHGSDRQGGSGNYRNNNSNNHSRDNNRNSGAGRDHRNRGQQSHRATNSGNSIDVTSLFAICLKIHVSRSIIESGSQQNKAPSEGYTYPVCTTCGRRHPGECRRAAGTCFKCGQAGHLQRDCKKNTGASSSGHADKKPDASGRVFALTQDQAANATGTITGALFIFGRAVT